LYGLSTGQPTLGGLSRQGKLKREIKKYLTPSPQSFTSQEDDGRQHGGAQREENLDPLGRLMVSSVKIYSVD
jgi:hypothetical protein